jgi:hypothetical protein
MQKRPKIYKQKKNAKNPTIITITNHPKDCMY